MKLSTMSEWLEYIASLNPKKMELGLDRVQEVANRCNILQMSCPVVTIGGTNGKGSTVATLVAIYQAAGYRVGSFTSPYLFNFNEQVKINNDMVTDDTFCRAFATIESARQGVKLTAFEYTTLAALWIFRQQSLDVILLEVGLGGRLDAVNIIDADVAIVTSIALDHCEWLGNTREEIAYEKAGIFKSGKFAVCGDSNPPTSLLERAKEVGAKLFVQGNDFFDGDFAYHETENNTWHWKMKIPVYTDLPRTTLLTQNMASALMALHLLQPTLYVNGHSIVSGLNNIHLTGRVEVIAGDVTTIFDVAHNPAAVANLVSYLKQHPIAGQTYAIFSMLVDKDITRCIALIKSEIDSWYVASIHHERGMPLNLLREAFAKSGVEGVSFHQSLVSAKRQALTDAKKGDRVIVFGSFHTVAECYGVVNRD